MDLFPRIPDRSNFARQAANLHLIKRLIQKALVEELDGDSNNFHIIDGFLMPICKFARAYFSQIFKRDADYGYCASKKEAYYGLKGHLVINSKGIIAAAVFTAANIDERDTCPELLEKFSGLILADRGYIRPVLKENLIKQNVDLQTPVRSNMEENRPLWFLDWMKGTRRLIETVIG